MVKVEAFMQLLELHQIVLSQSEKHRLKDQYGNKDGFIEYKQVLRRIQPNIQDNTLEWCLVDTKNKQKSMDDTKSVVSNWSADLSQVTVKTTLRKAGTSMLKNQFYTPQTLESIVEDAQDFKLGDDFASFNQRQSPSQQLAFKHSKYNKRKYQISSKPDSRIIDLQLKRQTQVENGLITPLQPQEASKKEGKKLVQSPVKDQGNLLYHDYEIKQHISDFKKPQDQSLDQVYKTKVSSEYLKKVLNMDLISDRKLAIIKKLYELNVDFRTFNFFRNNLYASTNQVDDKLPLEDYVQIKNQIFVDKIQSVEHLLLEEFKTNDNYIDLQKVTDIVDIYTYLPVKVKKDKNKSEDLYYAMTANRRGNHSALDVIQESENQDKDLQNALSIISAKINERFGTMREAFRFFDANLNQAISYSEFQQGLDQLTVKIANETAVKVFKFLDYDLNNSVTFNEFCALVSDKAKPTPTETRSTRNTSTQVAQQTLESVLPPKLYITNINMDDLEQISKLQSLSSLKKKQYKLKRTENNPRQFQSLECSSRLSKGHQQVQGDSITNVINHSYLKDYLEDKVTRNALTLVTLKAQKPKSIHNKSSELRSNSVARQIKLDQVEKEIEDMKLMKGLKNDVSFVKIHRNHLKKRKEITLPPISSRFNSSFKTPMSRLDTDSSRHLSPQKQGKTEEVLDEIHQLRMKVIEMKEQSNLNEKPTAMTKRQKEDILANYFQAKRQLGNFNQS